MTRAGLALVCVRPAAPVRLFPRADLRCGQQDVPIRVGSVPAVDAARKVAGRVRLLDYAQ